MSVFQVELKKVVDDSYEIEIGYQLENRLIEDLKNGLVGKIKKFAVITDSTVKELYADHIVTLLQEAGYQAREFVFTAGETSKTRKTKEEVEDAMLEAGFPARLLYHRRWWWCGNRFVWISGRNLWQRSAIH